jgi:hypothetical protein
MLDAVVLLIPDKWHDCDLLVYNDHIYCGALLYLSLASFGLSLASFGLSLASFGLSFFKKYV